MSFFFSSRRRHTISYGDWSSDVCSSDLLLGNLSRVLPGGVHAQIDWNAWERPPVFHWLAEQGVEEESGRASCRERVEVSVGAVGATEKQSRKHATAAAERGRAQHGRACQ